MPSLRIGPKLYTLPERFAPGHVCSREDAEVLSRAYVDAVRKRVDTERWPAEGLAQRIWDYALAFEWKLRNRTHARDRLSQLALELAQGADPASPEVLARAEAQLKIEQEVAQAALKEFLA